MGSERLSNESQIAARWLGLQAQLDIDDGMETLGGGAARLFRFLETDASVEEIDAFLSATTGELQACCLEGLSFMVTEVQPPQLGFIDSQLPGINAGKRWREAHPDLVAIQVLRASKNHEAYELGRKTHELVHEGLTRVQDGVQSFFDFLETYPSVEEIDSFLREPIGDLRQRCLESLSLMEEVLPPSATVHRFQFPAINAAKRWREAHPDLVAVQKVRRPAALALGRKAQQLMDEGVASVPDGLSSLMELLNNKPRSEEIDAFLSATTGELRHRCLETLSFMRPSRTEPRPQRAVSRASEWWRAQHPELVFSAAKIAEAHALGREAQERVDPNGVDSIVNSDYSLIKLLKPGASVEVIDAFLSATTGELRQFYVEFLSSIADGVLPSQDADWWCRLPAINAAKRWREAHPDLVVGPRRIVAPAS